MTSGSPAPTLPSWPGSLAPHSVPATSNPQDAPRGQCRTSHARLTGVTHCPPGSPSGGSSWSRCRPGDDSEPDCTVLKAWAGPIPVGGGLCPPCPLAPPEGAPPRFPSALLRRYRRRPCDDVTCAQTVTWWPREGHTPITQLPVHLPLRGVGGEGLRSMLTNSLVS